MHITRSRTLHLAPYLLSGHHLEAVEEAKYLGVILLDMSWTPHISNTAAAANKTLGLPRRNLRHAPSDLEEKFYLVLALPRLEYCITVWDPHKDEDRCALEKVRHRAARFATGRYRNRSSVSDIFDQLGWESLEQCRLKARATMAYRIRHQLVAIPADPFLERPTRSDRMKTRTYSHTVPVPFARKD